MYGPIGERIGCQIRPDNPRRDKRTGKEVKYEAPAGSEVRLDVHPSRAKHAKDASIPLWITEGVKKGERPRQPGAMCRRASGRGLLAEGRYPPAGVGGHKALWPSGGRGVRLRRFGQARGAAGLGRACGLPESRGAAARVVYLPDGLGGKKQGVDDYLVSGCSIPDLKVYAHEGIREDLSEVGRSLADVRPERVEWLWPRRIPKGKITVLDGDPDNGKSVLTTDLAARVTAGLKLPDGAPVEAAGAVLVSAEDGAADTIRPRFDAVGGDPTRARLLGDEEPFYIPEDVPRLERAIRQVGASLVVRDPIMAFLSGDVNSNRDQDVRGALTPLKRMAEKTGAAVILVRHLNKTPGGNPLYRGGGSIGIIGAARSGLVMGRHPDDEDLRVLAGQKNYLSLPPASLAYSIETAENGAARVAYRGVSETTAGQLLRIPADEEEKSAFSEAKEFLLTELSEGPVTYRQIEKDYRAAGVKERTLRRAKKEMGVRSEKEADGSWTWSLPRIETEGVQTVSGGNVGSVGNLAARDVGDESACLSKGSQGCQEGQGDQEIMCIHDFPGGKGCYVCDPRHPYRLKQGDAARGGEAV